MRSVRERLEDIGASIALIEQHVQGMDNEGFRSAFQQNPLLADTISYRFLVIGEAVNSLLGDPEKNIPPANIIAASPDIDWRGYAAMRNIVAHQYFRRSAEKIWVAIERELPALKRAVEAELHKLSDPTRYGPIP